MGDRSGLAGASAGEHTDRSSRGLHRRALVRIQSLQEVFLCFADHGLHPDRGVFGSVNAFAGRVGANGPSSNLVVHNWSVTV
nr:hypothetical protein [Kibdelosporangium sp. MJ126-NF4]CTQ95382.1 hypothetical protein [Kibdelosporangium sp. MJ126-NF4]